MQLAELALVAATMVLAPLALAAALAFLVHRQNQRVLADQADAALQAMLQTGGFLDMLARDPALPEDQRRRAQDLARDYPSGPQLQVFAEALLTDLRRASSQPSE